MSSSASPKSSVSAKERPPWLDSWYQKASTDNDGIHPHLRHYFDRRGMESTFRQRPQLDHPSTRHIKPRSPGRPSTPEKLAKWTKTASAPSLQSEAFPAARSAKPAKPEF